MAILEPWFVWYQSDTTQQWIKVEEAFVSYDAARQWVDEFRAHAYANVKYRIAQVTAAEATEQPAVVDEHAAIPMPAELGLKVDRLIAARNAIKVGYYTDDCAYEPDQKIWDWIDQEVS